jgi:hypothetical protein
LIQAEHYPGGSFSICAAIPLVQETADAIPREGPIFPVPLRDFVGRRLVPNLAESILSFYLVAAIFRCAAVLLGDTFKQLKLRKALEPPSAHL